MILPIFDDCLMRYRRRLDFFNPDPVLQGLSDEEYLVRIGAAHEMDDGLCLTDSGLLMLGAKKNIKQLYPGYFLDYREYSYYEGDEYIYRLNTYDDSWSGNVYDFYLGVINRLFWYIPKPFHLEMLDGVMTQIDYTPIHECIRNILLSCILNADYTESFPITVVAMQNMFLFSVSGELRIGKAGNAHLAELFGNIGMECSGDFQSVKEIWKQKGWKLPYSIEDMKNHRSLLCVPIDLKHDDCFLSFKDDALIHLLNKQ